MTLVDQPVDVREGDEFDIEAVDAFIRKHRDDLEGTPSLKQFQGGVSNLTYQLDYKNCSLILRRPPFGKKAKSAHDMSREHKVISSLASSYPYVPKIVAYTDDESIIGSEFYVMEKSEGIILRKKMPKELNFDEAQIGSLCENLVQKLVDLHNVDYNAAGLGDLGNPTGYVKRQVEGWNKRNINATTDDAPDVSDIYNWLIEKMPGEIKHCIVHNDYRFDNVVLNPENPTEIIAVLDWEMCTIGDALMDLGSSLTYWVEANDPPPKHMMRMQPTHIPGMFTRREFLDCYAKKSGIQIDNFDFYFAFGNFRMAIVIQQLYRRFKDGHSNDNRLAMAMPLIEMYYGTCREIIAKSEL